jgi:hypothetical protein
MLHRAVWVLLMPMFCIEYRIRVQRLSALFSYTCILKRAVVKRVYVLVVGPTRQDKRPTRSPDTAIEKKENLAVMQRCIAMTYGLRTLQTGRHT